jgi:hypothetical protein
MKGYSKLAGLPCFFLPTAYNLILKQTKLIRQPKETLIRTQEHVLVRRIHHVYGRWPVWK